MTLRYKNLKAKSGRIKSATGLTLKEFDFLTDSFEEEWLDYISLHTF